MHCSDLELLLHKYAGAETKEDQYIQRTLKDIAELFELCDQSEYYYADLITRNFCRVIEMMEKRSAKGRPAPCQTVQEGLPFKDDLELVRAFYNYYKEENQVDYLELRWASAEGRRELINPTMKDYVARIYTFSGPRYLGQMVSPEELGGMHPVLFTYKHIEKLLATFKTRDENGQIVRQRVNIRSALRKLNDFKQHRK